MIYTVLAASLGFSLFYLFLFIRMSVKRSHKKYKYALYLVISLIVFGLCFPMLHFRILSTIFSILVIAAFLTYLIWWLLGKISENEYDDDDEFISYPRLNPYGDADDDFGVIDDMTVDYQLSNIDSMGGHDFEYWCADLMRANNFINVEVTQGSGDQGVDVLAEKDGIKYAVQCKCWAQDLGNKPIQEVFTGKVYYDCPVGIVMTNRHFTQGAKDLAAATQTLLWDRDAVIGMLKSAGYK